MSLSKKAKLFTFNVVGMSKPTDAEMMSLVAAGEKGAFEVIYRDHKTAIYNFLFQYCQGDESLASEITQETFLKCYQKADQYKSEGSLRSWLMRIARNSAIDSFKRKDALNFQMQWQEDESGEYPSIEELSKDEMTAEAQLIKQVDRDHVKHCMGKLNLRQREAVSLRMFSELSYEEISETMETTVKSVKSLLSRAKAGLFKCLKGVMNDS